MTKDDSLVNELMPWLKALVFLKGVPATECDDVIAEAQAKAVKVLRDIDGGVRRPPTQLESYIRQVMRNVIADWLRSHRPAPISDGEIALLDDFAWSASPDEGDGIREDEPKGWRAEYGPTVTREPRPPGRPFLLTLVREMHRPLADAKVQREYWAEGGPFGRWEHARQLVDSIPNERHREIVLLHLQGYRQKDIARRVLLTQQAVSKVLRDQYAAWGWDDKQVQRLQFELAYVNLSRVIRRVVSVLSDRDEFELDEAQGFLEDLLREGPVEAKEVRSMSRLAMIAPHALDKARTVLGIVARRGDGGLMWELPKRRPRRHVLPISRSRLPWEQEEPLLWETERPSAKEVLAAHGALYRTIMNEPSLTPWTEGLKLHHIPRLVDHFDQDGYWYDSDDYLAPDIWNDASMQRIWEEACDEVQRESGH
jgi:DNA-directed RNA polymerase specialized sigma24 family protein